MNDVAKDALLIGALFRELRLTCQLKRERGICASVDCENCHIPGILAKAEARIEWVLRDQEATTND